MVHMVDRTWQFINLQGIVNNKTIKLYNYGQHLRDFTYVDDVVNSIMLVMKKIPSKKYFEIYNVGSDKKPDVLLKYN